MKLYIVFFNTPNLVTFCVGLMGPDSFSLSLPLNLLCLFCVFSVSLSLSLFLSLSLSLSFRLMLSPEAAFCFGVLLAFLAVGVFKVAQELLFVLLFFAFSHRG